MLSWSSKALFPLIGLSVLCLGLFFLIRDKNYTGVCSRPSDIPHIASVLKLEAPYGEIRYCVKKGYRQTDILIGGKMTREAYEDFVNLYGLPAVEGNMNWVSIFSIFPDATVHEKTKSQVFNRGKHALGTSREGIMIVIQHEADSQEFFLYAKKASE